MTCTAINVGTVVIGGSTTQTDVFPDPNQPVRLFVAKIASDHRYWEK